MLPARPCIPKGMNIGDLEYREGCDREVKTGSRETGLLSA